MPRKYEVPVFTGCAHAVSSCTCGSRYLARTGKVVTAIDERDVSMLLGTIRGVADRSHDGRTRDELRAALEPFEAEEGSGG